MGEPLCLWCGRPLARAPKGPAPSTCSIRCRVALHRDRQRRAPLPCHDAPGQVFLFQELGEELTQRVAALYVHPHGPYASMPGVDPWGEDRDASTWWGPDPVVAHPPCGPWGVYRHSCNQRADLAVRAVEQVRAFGGVLEHPAGSRLWLARELPEPGQPPDRWVGWSMLIRQSWWGHAAPKATWIYIVGTSTPPPVPPPVPDPGGRVEGMQRDDMELTPLALALWLVSLARSCRGAATGFAGAGNGSASWGCNGNYGNPVENLPGPETGAARRRCNGKGPAVQREGAQQGLQEPNASPRGPAPAQRQPQGPQGPQGLQGGQDGR